MPRPRNPSLTTDFGACLDIIQERYPNESLVEIFGKRVTRTAIIHWRDGRYNPPKWAREIVCQRMQFVRDLIAELDAMPRTPHKPDMEGLRRWQRHQRAQKQTAPG